MTRLTMSNLGILQRAIDAIEAGDKAAGKRLLAQVLRADPHNAQAWLWMSELVETNAQRRDCLLRASANGARMSSGQASAGSEGRSGRSAVDRESQATRAGLARPREIDEHQAPRSRPKAPTGRQTRPYAFPQEPSSASVTPPHARPLAVIAEARTLPDTQATPSIKGRPDGPLERVPLSEAQRKRGYRNIMLAGAMILTMVCGLVLLLVITTTLVPRARERMKPAPDPVLYMATLWCPSCAQSDSPIALWERPGDEASRGDKVGELPHDTLVSVLAEKWSQDGERAYLEVTAQAQQGWVSETLIKR
jgi:hypothetical protein